jgi:hypothetical protein
LIQVKDLRGRAKLDSDLSDIRVKFDIPPDYPTPNYAP